MCTRITTFVHQVGIFKRSAVASQRCCECLFEPLHSTSVLLACATASVADACGWLITLPRHVSQRLHGTDLLKHGATAAMLLDCTWHAFIPFDMPCCSSCTHRAQCEWVVTTTFTYTHVHAVHEWAGRGLSLTQLSATPARVCLCTLCMCSTHLLALPPPVLRTGGAAASRGCRLMAYQIVR
jgi:hypothetical protein